MKRIVVTGATSMIGTALIDECIKRKVEVLAIVRKNSVRLARLPQSEFLHICECDLDTLEKVTEIISLIEGCPRNYDSFYHFAWGYTAKQHRDNPVLQEENIKFTLDAVKLAHSLGCRKFIGAGSQAEYGKLNYMLSPDTPAIPSTAYGIAKYAAGILSQKLCIQYEMVHIWGRIFSVYGCNDNEGTMLDYAINQFLCKKPAQFSSALQMWDYLYESDAGRMFFELGEKVEKTGMYCIASGDARPLRRYIMEMQEVFGSGAICEFAKETSEEVYGIQADISKLIEDTGYMPQVSFREGIAKMIQFKIKEASK